MRMINIFYLIIFVFFFGCEPRQLPKQLIQLNIANNQKTLPSDCISINKIFDRIIEWKPTRMNLEIKKCIATAGPCFFENSNNEFAYYSISIEYKIKSGITHILFLRDIPISKVSKETIKKHVKDIVSFNNKTRVVHFDLGKSSYKYKIPLMLDQPFEGEYIIEEVPPPPPGYEKMEKRGDHKY